MRKLLRPSDWLFLGLAGFLDVIEEIRDPFYLYSSYYLNLYGFIPTQFRRNNYKQLVWRGLKVNNIEKKVINGKPCLELTEKGKKNIKKRFPLFTLNHKVWDNKWRIVIFDIEEKNKIIRETLRRKLKELGFGQLQKSVWITPHDFLDDFRDYIDEKKLTEFVILIETPTLITDDLISFASKIWNLDKLDTLYWKIYYQLLDLKSKEEKRLTPYGDRNKWLNSLRNQIVSTYFIDPFLPRELLRPDWKGNEVKKLCRELKLFAALSTAQ